MTIKRRQFLTATAGGLAAGAIAAPAVAQSMPDIKWRLTSSFPRVLDTIFGTAQQLSKYVAEATDNKFQISTFPAGELVPGLQALDAVQSGSVECAQTPIYFYHGKDPTLSFGTGVPFGLNARMQHSWWHFGGGADIINPVLAKFNAIGFAMGNSGTQMGGFFRKELNGLEDLNGLKFRIGGLGGQVVAKLGAVPQQIAPGDVYPALEKGTIDAAEFVGPYDDEKLGFHKIAKYYYYPGWWEGGAMMHLVVNIEQWNKLPANYKRILQDACEAANNWMLAKYDAVNAPALRRLIAGGAVLKPFPLPVMEAAYKSAHDIYNEIAAGNPTFKQALESYTGFRNEVLPWWQVGELSFDSFMARMRTRG